jgi:hypothetical protein
MSYAITSQDGKSSHFLQHVPKIKIRIFLYFKALHLKDAFPSIP